MKITNQLLKQLLNLLSTGLVIFLILTANNAAYAHGGDDHGESGFAATEKKAASGTRIKIPKRSQELLEMQVETAMQRFMAKTITALGRVTPKTGFYARVYSPRPGLLINNSEYPVFDIGSKVKKGQPIAMLEQVLSTIEMIELIKEKIKIETQLSQAKQNIELVKANLNRQQALKKIKAAKEIQKTETEYKIAKDLYNGLLKQQELFEALSTGGKGSKNQFEIKAPISGTVIESHITIGEQVDTDKLILEIMNLSEVWVVADIFESDLANIRNAKTAYISTNAYPGDIFIGNLMSVGQKFDEVTRTVKAIFEVSNEDEQLKSGMFVNLSINIGENAEMLSIPASAVIERDGKKIVYVQITDDEFEAREVVTGHSDDKYVEILSGINEGEMVVTTGSYQLQYYKEQ